jgi:hypothetical protein
VTKIIREPLPKRFFDEWSMGFHGVSRAELVGLSGVNDFFGRGQSLAKIDVGRAQKVLTAFREGRWRKKLTGARQHTSA